jgi:hypothetical protein
MTNKKSIYLLIGLLFLFTLILCGIQPARRCTQCNQPIYIEDVETGELGIYRESLIVRIFSPNASFLHWLCVQDYLHDHPIERDQNGRIIPKINYPQEQGRYLPLALRLREEQ